MKHSFKVGLSFGLTSGVITTMGMMIGLYAGTQSKIAVTGGILTIAIADAFSDALGIHMSEESENVHKPRSIWESTLSTFLSKFFFALTFLIPVLLFELKTAVIVGGVWGMLALGILSYKITEKERWNAVIEHMIIGAVVIAATYYAGEIIASLFA